MTIKKILVIPVAIATMALGAMGHVSAQTASPLLAIQLTNSGLTNPLVANGSDATVARLILDTTGSTDAVRVSTLPFILTTGNGAVASTLNGCQLYNEANGTVAISPDTSASLAGGINNIALNSSLTLPANSITTLSLRCDVAGDLATNGTFTFSMDTADVSAVGATTGLPAVVVVRGATIPPVIIPPVVVPGIPSTGASGEATGNIAALLGSVLVAALGIAYIRQARA